MKALPWEHNKALYLLLCYTRRCQQRETHLGRKARSMTLLSGFYVLLTVHLDAILGNDQLDALFLNAFILRLYMFRAASAHHEEGRIVLIHHLV
jgi:hypothetical protein